MDNLEKEEQALKEAQEEVERILKDLELGEDNKPAEEPEKPTEKKPEETKPAEKPEAKKPAEKKPAEKSEAKKSTGTKPAAKSMGTKSTGTKPAAKKSTGTKPAAKKSTGTKPSGTKSTGKKPTGKKPAAKGKGTGSKKKKKIAGKVAYIAAFVLLVAVFIGSAIYLIRYYGEKEKSEDLYTDLREMKNEPVQSPVTEITEMQRDESGNEVPVVKYVEIDGVRVLKEYAGLYEKNRDFVGWLMIDGTEIDYPVMCTPDDEEFYLHRDFNKEYNANGTLFIDTDSDYNTPGDNVLIYGHNMKNGTMFHELLSYKDEEFYKKHKLIRFDTLDHIGTYEVIAAFYTKVYPDDMTGVFKYYEFFEAENEESFNTYVDTCRSMMSYVIPHTAQYGDKLISLSTCTNADEDGRFVVVAKLISSDREEE